MVCSTQQPSKATGIKPLALLTGLFLAGGLALAEPGGPLERSLNLEQALELAYAGNPDMRAAQERIGLAQAQVTEAVAAFYPKLVGRMGYSYSDDPALAFSYIVSQRRFNNGHFQDINNPGFVENFRPELVGTLSLFRGGTDYYRKKAAELGVEVAELERAAYRNQLAASVSAAYYAAMAAPKQLAAAKHSVEAVEGQLKQARSAYQEGALLKADMLSLEARLGQAREAELRARNAVELSLAGLKTLLGLGAADRLRLQETAELKPASLPRELSGLITQALGQRPEMLASSHHMEIRERELRAEQGGHLPRVNAYAAYGLNERTPQFNFKNDNLTMGISAEVDIFAGGATSARVEGARRKLAEAQALRERTRLEIEEEVQKSFASRNEAEARESVAEASLAAAGEAYRLVSEQYRAGAAPVTRYLDAEADRSQAESRAVLAHFDAQTARANLQKALGYWK